jgi:cytidine deaminase
MKNSTDELFQLAKASRDRSHAPYSKCKIGAAVRMSNGEIYGGCNVENSSYGGTVCAERVAIQKAVSEGSPSGKDVRSPLFIEEAVVVTDANPPWPPCGICRQVMMEFAKDASAVKVHLADLRGIKTTLTLAELLPTAFTADFLP